MVVIGCKEMVENEWSVEVELFGIDWVVAGVFDGRDDLLVKLITVGEHENAEENVDVREVLEERKRWAIEAEAVRKAWADIAIAREGAAYEAAIERGLF